MKLETMDDQLFTKVNYLGDLGNRWLQLERSKGNISDEPSKDN